LFAAIPLDYRSAAFLATLAVKYSRLDRLYSVNWFAVCSYKSSYMQVVAQYISEVRDGARVVPLLVFAWSLCPKRAVVLRVVA
jgi:hypothetical protein